MDDETKLLFRNLLLDIVQGDLEAVDIHYGLCGNLSLAVPNDNEDTTLGYLFVGQNCSDWSYFSGCTLLPVGGGYSNRSKWQGKQLKLRQSLAQHLLTKLEENTYVL